MKTVFRIVFPLLFLGVFILLLLGLLIRIKQSSVHQKNIKSLPDFSFSTLEGRRFKSSDIKSGPVIIVYFHPECEHCQYEIDELLNNLDRMDNPRLILISSAEKDSITRFIENRIDTKNVNISVLVDDSLRFENFFGSKSVPALFVYDKNLKLLNHYSGEVKSETLIKCLNSVASL